VLYQLSYSEEAKRALRTAPGFYRQRFRRAIEGLASNPRPPEAKSMRDHDRYKIRFDDWRLIYSVLEESHEVLILRIARKRGPETYQGLPER
jgi:mRNA interferase RelE/StbE